MSRRSWGLLGIASFASLVFLSAACSSGGSSSAASGTSSGASGQLTSVKIGVGYGAIQYGPAYLAQSSGAFAANGLNVSFEVSPTGVLSALAGGSLPVALISSPQPEVANLDTGSTQIVWLATWDNNVYSSLLVRPGVSISDKSRTFTAAFTSASAPSTLLTKYAASQLGIDPSRLRNVGLTSTSAILAAWQAGKIDLMFANNLHLSQYLDAQPGSKVIYQFNNVPMVWGGLAANLAWVKAHPALTVSLLKAINTGLSDWHTDPSAAQKAIVAATSGATTAADAVQQYKETLPVISKAIEPVSLSVEQNVLSLLKGPGDMPSATQGAAQSMFDNTYVNEAG